MTLLVGLGNIGKNYKYTKHNLGFLLIDYLFSYFNVSNFSSNFKSSIAQFSINNHKIYLQKPSTFMNLSGEAVLAIKQFYKIENDDIIVFHDDINLDFNEIKYKTNSGDGGQKGVRDIQNKLGKDIHRIKIGIGKPEYNVSDYVLSNFSKSELLELNKTFEAIAVNLELLIEKNFNKFIQKIKENK